MADGNHSPPYSESHGCNLPGAAASTSAGDGCINGQDHLLPIAIVGRLMKQALPPGAKISKEAKETLQECATEFIGFVTGEATDRCRKEKRKTINGDDICCAFKTLGLDEYANIMRRYLDKYREHGERAISMKHDKSIQIDMRDELSATRSDQYKNQELAMFPHETNVLERGRKFL